MKKIDRLILRSFIGPLILTFAIAVFVLLMQFVWKYVDDMVGKGLEFKVIAELLFYASATFVPMALPIAVLFASIMTMGNFGEKYELVAMKAGGISLHRVMRPMAIVAVLLMGVGFYFSNNVMPVAMLQYRTILYDVTRKKPALNIRPGEYYKEIDGYVIRINEKDPDGMTLRDITIYDHSKGPTQDNIIVAERGMMQTSADERYLIFTLYNGCYYNELSGGDNYMPRPFTRINFEKEIITFDISSFAFNASDKKFFEGSYQMLNVSQLRRAAGKYEKESARRRAEYRANIDEKFRCINDKRCQSGVAKGSVDRSVWDVNKGLDGVDAEMRSRILNRARVEAVQVLDQVRMYEQILQSDNEYINRHYIELQRKFTLSVACLLLFLVGAPFGSIVRKGGLGMPLVASVGFFVLYYVVGMIAEKAVRESAIGPIGMWISSFVLLPIGIFLTIQAATDRNLVMGQWFTDFTEWCRVRWRYARRQWYRRKHRVAVQQ